MKLFCLLLSLYVIVLSTKPCCADNDCQANAAVKKELASKSPVKGDECPGCSPFFTCGSCVGFIIAQPLTLHLPAIALNNIAHTNFYKQPHMEKVALAIWLPPKLS